MHFLIPALTGTWRNTNKLTILGVKQSLVIYRGPPSFHEFSLLNFFDVEISFMTNAIFFGQSVINWVWTTPVWLISVGVTIGVVLCAAILIAGFVLSFVPGLNTINENPRNRLIAAIGLTIVTNLILIPFFWMPACVDWMNIGHHLGAYQPNLKLEETANNPPGSSALILALLLGVTTIYMGWLTFFALCSRKLMSEIGRVIMEGPMGWLVWIGVVFVFFAVMGIVLKRTNGLGVNALIVEKPMVLLDSLPDLQSTGVSKVQKFTIAPDIELGQEIEIDIKGQNLRKLEIYSDQAVQIQSTPFATGDAVPVAKIQIEKQNLKIPESEPIEFLREGISSKVIPISEVSSLYVKNESSDSANLEIRVVTVPTVKELQVLPFCVFGVLGFFLFYMFMRGVMPKVSAVALSTFKTEVSQPVYTILLVAGIIGVCLFVILPYNTFGEDIKMLKDSGLTLILVFSIFLAIWASSKSIAEEIEGRTALTVLSKPIGRRQFIVGKFLGIAWALAIFAIIVGLIFFIPAVSYKTTYDAKEAAQEVPSWQKCHAETVKIIPGLALGFMETLVFIAISVTISTRLPIMANILICFSIYVLGHLTPLIVQSTVAVDAFETVVFFGRLIATVFPVLDHFNIQAAISGDAVVPMSYLGWSLIYCTIYGAIALLLGLIFFEDRDVA